MPYDDDIDEQEPFPRIARPQNSPLPTVSLRGVGAMPVPGIPENPNLQPKPATSAPAAKIPSPLGQRRTADEKELARLNDTGSGVAQIGRNHPIAGGLLRGLNVVGGIVAPGLMSRIPGTEEHHQQLVNREQGKVATDIAEQQKEAQAEEQQAKAEQEQAKADDLRNPKPKPKEETWKVVPGVVGPGGKVLQEEATSGQLRWAEGIEGVGPLKEPAENDKEKDIKDVLAANNWPDDAKHREQAREVIAKRAPQAHIDVAGPGGEWQLAEGANGETVLYNPKTGQTKAAPAGVAPKGTHAKQQSEYEKKIAPLNAALDFADTYLKSGKFTGSDDDILMLQYFELAKPESGFRLTQAEIKRQNDARSWRDSIAAQFRHATTGTWFSDEQRKQIVDSMHHIGDAKKAARQGGAAAGAGVQGSTAVSLSAARQLPINKGKSDDEIRKDIEAHGHKVVD